jgi:hypothetical protein
LLSEFFAVVVQVMLAQFLKPGAALIIRGAVPDDDFHMIGRNIASTHVTVVHALPVEGTNPLAIHIRL